MSDLHESREYLKVNLSNTLGQFDSYKMSTLVSVRERGWTPVCLFERALTLLEHTVTNRHWKIR